MMTGSSAQRSLWARRAGPRRVRPPVRLRRPPQHPHGVTRQVPLAVEVNGFGPDPWGGQRAGFSATAQIGRRDFGIDLTIPMDGGGVNTRKKAGR